MRYDQDGNGDRTSVPFSENLVNAAFPNRERGPEQGRTWTGNWFGCPSSFCSGFELVADIVVPPTTGTRNFLPIPFWNTTFEGNGHTISGLKMQQPAGGYQAGRVGLFAQLNPQARVRNFGIINPDITLAHSTHAGGVAAETHAGSVIANVYVQGGSITQNHASALSAGGLVGSHKGHIIASWSSAAISSTGTHNFSRGGGLVGTIGATTASATIVASYATGAVSSGAAIRSWLGGIVGEYATASSTIQADITNSYCSAATGVTNVAQRGIFGTPQESLGGSCQSASALQTPTDYTGIYAGWNVDTTADGIPDNPWYFGATSTYPILSYQRTPGPTVDYDADDDGYIDVSNLHQLDALRYDSNGDGDPNSAAMTAAYELGFRDRETASSGRMGCPTVGGCIGYELTGDLVIPAAGTPYTQWAPIGGFNSALLGRGHTINGLRVNSDGDAGLFSALGSSARVLELGLVNPSVTLAATTTPKSVGALAGFLPAGARLGAVYVSGGSVTVNNNSSYAGGLVGFARGAIRAAYSGAAVTAAGNTSTAGGLVGGMSHSGAIIASYAYGAVTSTAPGGTAGGLVGRESGNTVAITDSYCDTTAGGLSDCIGAQSGGTTLVANGYATAALRSPVNYDGIYAHWNIDVNLDANSYPDNPWWFGTSSDYPRLRWQRPAGPPVDYDVNDNNLIEVSNLNQLYAMRHDLNGDGAPDNAERGNDYALGYPDAATGTPPMGCATACAGYELTASLTFPSATSLHHPWTPIGGVYNTVFDGQGNTLTGLTVEAAAGHAGLFAELGGSGVIRDLGLVNPDVSVTTAGNRRVGALVGQAAAGSRIDTSYVSGGRVTVSVSQADGGGMVGRNLGAIRASYATARVESTGASANLRLGGLVGRHRGGRLAAVYAAGAVAPSASSTGFEAGGLVGLVTSTAPTITAGYCDAGAAGLDDCIGRNGRFAGGVTAAAVSAAALQTPTGYTGLYVPWNLDLDGDDAADHPWNFGTSSQYPTPNSPAQRAAAPTPAATDYDANNNNLIDIGHVDQLNALRWDADGDGDPDVATSTPFYDTIFPGRTATATGRMGCPDACAGYELTADLTYPTATGSGYIPYWVPPDAAYQSVFDGKGHTITNINIYVPPLDDPGGLFGVLGGSSTVRDLGIINGALLSESSAGQPNGLLAGTLEGEATSVYSEGGSVTISTAASAGGGLVGRLTGTLRAAWSTAAVTATGTQSNLDIGGLIGARVRGTLIASFAAGAVTSSPTVTLNAGGGLMGGSYWAEGTVTDSYCDTEASGQSDCIGLIGFQSPALTAPGYTTAQLQTPTDYAGTIYADWNLDFDADFFPDYPWNFGGASDYPRLNTPAQRLAAAPETTDYDVNDNGLIDIASLAHLDAMRYDANGDGIPESATTTYNAAFSGRSGAAMTRMGCPMGACTGYELTMSLTFPAATSSPYTPWTPIAGYGATLDGAGYTLTDLQIETGSGAVGLIGRLNAGGLIRDLGLINPAVTSTGSGQNTGALVGYALPTTNVDASYVSGGSVSIAGTNSRAGGLAGLSQGRIRASYSTAAVGHSGNPAGVRIGGLVAHNWQGEIVGSYAAGPVAASSGTSSEAGGLVGRSDGATDTITDSVCDTAATTQTACVGATVNTSAAAAQGYDTAALQTPTGYEGPYAHWNLDLDASGAPDYLWNFGTASQYPTLHPPTARAGLIPSPMDYDANDNDLIDIESLAQLNAIRWDLDGDGAPDADAVRPGYDTAFPGRTTTTTGRMGCPNTCAGYELTLSLTFPASTSSAYNPWTPVAAYAAEFNGNGHTLTDLNVSVASGHAGLFHSLNSGALVRNVGLIEPYVTAGGVTNEIGGLAGRALAGSSIETSYVRDGEVAIGNGGQAAGGLVGYLEGSIRASYANGVALRTTDPCTNCNNINLGGLAGYMEGAAITGSYAAATSGPILFNQQRVGGLVGRAISIVARPTTITNSYCDTERLPGTNAGNCVANQSGLTLASGSQTTAALQTPTGYEGPYVHWNLDLDASGRPDYLWNFGTTGQYPTLHTPTARPPLPPLMDYDANNNDLIDIESLAQLNAIRWDLDGDGAPDAAGARPGYDTAFPGRTTTTTGRMGCPNTCAGYELTMSLTFPAETSSPYNPWTPIDEYAGDFDGRGYTLTDLNVATEDYAGLFGRLNSGGLIRDVGMINPIVTLQGDGTRGVGGLVGTVRSGGQVDTSYVAGGRITLTGGSNRGGGLVGQSAGLIRASYASAEVRTDAARDGVAIGGLVGRLSGGLVASYAYGAVSASGNNINVGGLVGRSTGASSAITDSYCDTAATMQTACVGPQSGNAVSAQGYLTAALQNPTDYAGGIYVNWNLDLDGNYAPDYPWNFGASSDYPTLNTPAQRAAAAPPPVDYDQNDNGLIDIRSIAQLHAIRWDANGDGVPESNPAIYSTIFEGRITATSTRMGCPAGNCNGYELAMSLTFPSETTSPYNPWTPIANYEATFDGGGYTLTGLRIETSSGDTGLIGSLNSGGLIRDLGLINPAVTSTGANQNTGALAGQIAAGANVDTSYVSGGRVNISGTASLTGGLAGQNQGRIRASYSTAAVGHTGDPANVSIGGLVGYSWAGETVASYAAGPVTGSAGTGARRGGLVGHSRGATDTITNSVCDTGATGQTNCVGSTDNGSSAAAAGFNTADLQRPTGYHFPYTNWNLDLNGDGVLDYPWNFRAANEYPALHTPAQRAQLIPEPMDYDADDDNLIDIRTIEQLNAMRYDLNNGDGDPEPANANAYGTAFPGRATSTPGRMGCLDVCAGYELVADLTFPSETTSPYNPWTPIGGFLDTVLDGKGHSLTNLRVEFNGHAGLFHQIGGVGRVRNLGLINPSVTSTANGRGAGALAGQADTGSVVEYVYVHGGRIATTGGGGGANTAWVGGLIGEARGIVRASYAGAAVAATQTESVRMGGLVGGLDGAVIESFAYGPVLSTAAQNSRGGLIGSATADGQVASSYCDLTTGLQTACIGPSSPSFTGTADGKTTAELQTPTGYEDGIYQNWNQDLDNDPNTDDPVWDFGGRDQYPALWYERRTAPDSPPPGGPRQAQPPQDTPYNPAADHPEIYENPRHQITATCNVQYNADGAPETSAITFNLGNYQGQVILHLAIWNGEHFMSYESQGIDLPTFQRNGQTATVRITTNPVNTRFLLDSISPTTNLVLGYADCHTDDHTGVLATPGAAAPETPTETATTSTPADTDNPTETAATSTPPTPKVYTNDRYEMTASCEVQHNADGEPESSQITFNLGNYQQTVILSISLWNGEYYASLESHSLPEPTLERDGQSATVLVTTNPAETRFLLDGTPNGLRTNLLLGYADCHTAGE